VDKDGFVEEKATALESYDVLYTYDLDVSSFIDELMEEVKYNDTYDSYILSTGQDDDYSYGMGKRDYLDLENYKNKSTIISEMFSNVSISDNNGVVSITMTPNDSFEYFEEDELYSAVLDEVNIKISVPYVVVSSNSDSIEDNVYIWNIQKDEDLKRVYISYDTNEIVKEPINTNTWIVIGVSGAIILAGLFIYIRYKRTGA